MLKGFNTMLIIWMFVFSGNSSQNLQYKFVNLTAVKSSFFIQKKKSRSKKKNKKSTKNIKKICKKAKAKITAIEAKARQKSTVKTQRCKKAYSELRYQSCHLKKYNQKKIDAAKRCGRR